MKLLDDPYLKPYEDAIRGRSRRAFDRAAELAGDRPLADWASAHEYFGLHRVRGGWVFREWAPNASSVALVGDFSDWKVRPQFACRRLERGVWEAKLPAKAIRAGQNYLLDVRWPGGGGYRVPAYARYVVQDPKTNEFCAQVYVSGYRWRNGEGGRQGTGDAKGSGQETRDAARIQQSNNPTIQQFPPAPFIYEAHVGMAGEEPRVSSYAEFRDRMLPRIRAAGYDTVQLMAVMEHPYYGSFGYHVSSFFAASSRFGTPDDLKSLVDAAHGMGLRVIMDLVHSHAVRNEREGLSNFDGTDAMYFHAGDRGWHRAWGSRCFDYGKTEVLHFLLSNCRFWLDEYRFDGYRFDGVTSMLYYDHGLGTCFTDYGRYFDGSTDDDAWVYLQLANRVIHESHPEAITIAEDVSGVPGCAAPVGDSGIGFDYRMAMGEPDFWFRLAEKVSDEDWPMAGLYHELTNRRAEEKVVSYVESHDQALVGGKTFFFQLADAAIYWGMEKNQHGEAVERGVALHKMARLATASLAGGAYLNFMGNEFGHPEWIDFPRAENGWSYAHARRQWSLRENPDLKFRGLADFDAAMVRLLKGAAPVGAASLPPRRCVSPVGAASLPPLAAQPVRLKADEGDKILAYLRGDLLFAFNFHPTRSYADYGVLVPPASKWRHVLDTDEPRFGGWGRIRPGGVSEPALVEADGELVQQIRLYLPSRTALVLRRI